MGADFLLSVAIGFLAQVVDGALGMAFGIICSSSLIALGLPPAIASASVHAAEIVTTGISGGSHIYHRNVDNSLFLKIVITGVLGGATGAYILTGLPEASVKVFVTIYLTGMALLIVNRMLGRAYRGFSHHLTFSASVAVSLTLSAVAVGGRLSFRRLSPQATNRGVRLDL